MELKEEDSPSPGALASLRALGATVGRSEPRGVGGAGTPQPTPAHTSTGSCASLPRVGEGLHRPKGDQTVKLKQRFRGQEGGKACAGRGAQAWGGPR